jgi:hypothetical protein
VRVHIRETLPDPVKQTARRLFASALDVEDRLGAAAEELRALLVSARSLLDAQGCDSYIIHEPDCAASPDGREPCSCNALVIDTQGFIGAVIRPCGLSGKDVLEVAISVEQEL